MGLFEEWSTSLAERRSPQDGADLERFIGRIAQVDAIIGAIDDRRRELGWSKADLARHAGVEPSQVRRLFSLKSPRPTLLRVVELADAVDLVITASPRGEQVPEFPRRQRNTTERATG